MAMKITRRRFFIRRAESCERGSFSLRGSRAALGLPSQLIYKLLSQRNLIPQLYSKSQMFGFFISPRGTLRQRQVRGARLVPSREKIPPTQLERSQRTRERAGALIVFSSVESSKQSHRGAPSSSPRFHESSLGKSVKR